MEMLFERHGCIVYRISAEPRFVNVKLERITSIATIVLVNVFLGVVISNELVIVETRYIKDALLKNFFFGRKAFLRLSAWAKTDTLLPSAPFLYSFKPIRTYSQL